MGRKEIQKQDLCIEVKILSYALYKEAREKMSLQKCKTWMREWVKEKIKVLTFNWYLLFIFKDFQQC